MKEKNGKRWFSAEGGRFGAGFACPDSLRDAFEVLTGELVDFQLAAHARPRTAANGFEARVIQSRGKPFLKIPTAEDEPGLRDIDLAERLGYERPRTIRDLVERLGREGKLNDPELRRVARQTGGRPATEFWLTEATTAASTTCQRGTRPKSPASSRSLSTRRAAPSRAAGNGPCSPSPRT